MSEVAELFKPPGSADAWMDTEQLLATAQSALMAANGLMDLWNADQANAQPELEAIALSLAEALDAVLAWMPRRDADANQLYGATSRWLP